MSSLPPRPAQQSRWGRTSYMRSFSRLALVSSLVLCGAQTGTPALEAFTGVDWYNPPPKHFEGAEAELSIPTELIGGVYPYRINEAIALLRNANIIEITSEQAKQLSFVGDPGRVLQILLHERRTKLDFLLARPPKRDRYPREVWSSVEATAQSNLRDLEKEIVEYERWQGSLKPYLIKAVSLGGTTAPFSAGIVRNNLFVSHIALGDHPLPMRRMPVVAYLPRKPETVYHVLSRMR